MVYRKDAIQHPATKKIRDCDITNIRNLHIPSTTIYPRNTIAPAANNTNASGLAKPTASLLDLLVAAADDPAVVLAASELVVVAAAVLVFELVSVAWLIVVLRCSAVPVATDKVPTPTVPIAPVPAATVLVAVALVAALEVRFEMDATREDATPLTDERAEETAGAEVTDCGEMSEDSADEAEIEAEAPAALPPERVNWPE